MKFNYKTGGNELLDAGMTAGTAMVGMIASNQLLNFQNIFKNMYAKNPQGFIFQYEGLIKAGLGAGAIFFFSAMSNKKMHPALKGLLIGLMLQGAFQQIRKWTVKADGSNAIDQIGNANMTDLDALMKQAALQGEQSSNSTGIGNQPSIDLMQNASSGIGFAWDFLPQDRMAA